MKKLPILLSILTLAPYSTNAAALEGGVTMAEMGNASRTGMIANAIDSRAQIISVLPETTGVVVRTEHFDATKVLKRVHLATYDFETGLTEIEADLKALSLGENGQEAWMKQYYAKTIIEDMSKQNVVMVYFTETGENLRKNNPTDLFYYALEYVDADSGAGESLWIRGKIDYRSCVKASTYGGQYWAECKPVEVTDGTGGAKNVFLPDGQTVLERNLPTWEDDLTQIARDALKGVDDQVTEMEGRFGNSETVTFSEVQELVAEFEEKKAYIERIHAADMVADDVWMLSARLDWLVLVTRSEETTPDPKPNTGEEGEESGDKSDEPGKDDIKDESGDENLGDGGELGDGKDEGSKDDESASGEDSNKGETIDDTKDDEKRPSDDKPLVNAGGVGGTLGTTGTSGTTDQIENVVENTKTEVETGTNANVTTKLPVIVTATMGSTMEQILESVEQADTTNDDRQGSNVISEDKNSEIEVPNLGNETNLANKLTWVWWIVGISLGGLALWWVKRAFFSKKQQS